jgi:hypothetical protein
MSWSASKAGTSCSCFPFVPVVPVGVGTPKGFKLGSRGQGRAFCAPPPTDRSPTDPADPEGVDPFGPSRAESFFRRTVTVDFTHGYSCSSLAGSTETVKPLRVSLVEPVAYSEDSYERAKNGEW